MELQVLETQPKAGMAVVRSRCQGLHEINAADWSVAHGNRLSSTISGDPEKQQDMEIVDWDGPDDPENPYEQQS